MNPSPPPRGPVKRSGARRLGDGYQDTVALDKLVEWLEHPERYRWMKVEADDAGSLDDVIACRSDGVLIVQQVKYSTAPDSDDDRLTWDLLLERPAGASGPKQSLLQKWFASLRSLATGNASVEASLVTNRKPVPEFARQLSADGCVDYARVESAQTSRIVAQLGSETEAQGFFSRFRFHLDQMGLDVLEEALWRRFSRCGGSEHGWANLQQELRRWMCYKGVPRSDGTITLADIKQAALWYRLQSLPQGFEIPADYVLPSQNFHDDLIRRVTAPGAGCTVLFASPGAGKSTYVSKLYRELTDQRVPVIRHHYFLSLGDPNSSIRLDHLRAAESLMHDLQRDHAEALGQLAERNSNPAGGDLRKWLEECGGYYQSQQTRRSLVVILDGLDHVWRENRSVEELNRLFQLLLPVPPGVQLILATQRVDDRLLPPALLRVSPTEGWLELPLLDLAATTSWVGHHLAEIETDVRADDEDGRHQLAAALFRRSGGHPLHLRYTLRTAQERGLRLTEETVATLPECQHDGIVGYYRSLWQVLPEQSRQVLHLLATARFPWPRDGVRDCLDPSRQHVALVTDALKQVDHLLTTDGLGLRPFHGSLLVFVGQQPEHQTFSQPLRERVSDWLARCAPEYWKWAYNWLFAAESGKPDLLVNGPDRTWVVEAIASQRPRRDVREILSRAIRLALEHNRLARAIRLSLWLQYAEGTHEDYYGAPPNLLFTRLRVSNEPHVRAVIRATLAELTDSDIVLLAEAESIAGNTPAVRSCANALLQRARGYRERTRHWSPTDPILSLKPLLAVSALPQGSAPGWVAGLAAANREKGFAIRIIDYFAEQLRVRKSIDGLRELLVWRETASVPDATGPDSLTEDEKGIVVTPLLLLALEEGIDANDVALTAAAEPVAIVYAAIRRLSLPPSDLLLPDTELLNVKEFRYHQRQQDATEIFHEAFFVLLAGHLSGCPKQNTVWLEHIGPAGWQHRFVAHLDRVAAIAAEHIRTARCGGFGAIHAELSQYPRPKFRGNENMSEVDYGHAAARAVLSIGLDAMVLFLASGCGGEISRSELQTAFTSGYCHPELWVEAYLATRRTWLSADAVDWLVSDTRRDLETSIVQFPERAERYARLASVAAIHGLSALARELARQAAENSLAHGSHKDMVFDHVLNAARAFHKGTGNQTADATQNPKAWLLRLAPAIAVIDDYTDGDETSHMPRELASALAEVAPDLLPDYCSWLAGKEEYYDAVHAVNVFVASADLGDPVAQAIARTVTDPGTRSQLEERAATDENAQSALAVLTCHFGQPDPDRDHPASNQSSTSLGQSDTEEQDDRPQDWPPERFAGFLEQFGPYGMYRESERVVRWMSYWKASGRAKDALDAVASALERGHEFDACDFLYEYAVSTIGRERAYPWLERANARKWGWSRFYTNEKHAVARWEIVKQYYPTRWYRFMRNTIIDEQDSRRGLWIGTEDYVRLVGFLLFVGQPDLARDVIGEMVAGVMELVSPLSLVTPEWTIEGVGCG